MSMMILKRRGVKTVIGLVTAALIGMFVWYARDAGREGRDEAEKTKPYFDAAEKSIQELESKEVVEKEKSRERTIESLVKSTFEEVSREDNFDVRFPEGAKLVLKNTNGSIRVYGQETDQCSIKADTRIALKDEERARKLLNRVLVQVRPSNEIVWVEVELAEELQGNQLIKVDFEITLPRKADLKLITGNGSVDIRGIKGDISCGIGNGIITAEEIAGSVQFSINFGEIMVRKADFDESLITANNGPVTCEDVSGNIELKVNSGDVKVRYAKTAPSVCNVNISANNGDINFTGPVDFSAMVEAKTMVGKIEMDLPLIVEHTDKSEVAGKLGKGEGKLVLRAIIGSIKINSNIIETVNQSGDSGRSNIPAEVVQPENK